MAISTEDEERLLDIRDHLGVKTGIYDSNFQRQVIEASVAKLNAMKIRRECDNGEDFISDVASNLNVDFEEVHSQRDVAQLQEKYLKQKEIAFGQLELELRSPDVDALLFRRKQKPSHYVAVLNLQQTGSRAYWNKAHEVTHRLIEPPQKRFLFRHQADQKDPVERLVDIVAAEVAFYKPLFDPIVSAYSHSFLTWDIVEEIKQLFAPSSSLMAATNAIIRQWPTPVFLVKGEFRGRKRSNQDGQALRSTVIGRNVPAERSGVFFFPNMRIPESSPASSAFYNWVPDEGQENLSTWGTSDGSKLPNRKAFTSSKPYYKQRSLTLITLI